MNDYWNWRLTARRKEAINRGNEAGEADVRRVVMNQSGTTVLMPGRTCLTTSFWRGEEFRKTCAYTFFLSTAETLRLKDENSVSAHLQDLDLDNPK